MIDDRITIERIDELLRFPPLFDAPGRKYVKAWAGGDVTSDGAITFPYPECCDDVLEFFCLFAHSGSHFPRWNADRQ